MNPSDEIYFESDDLEVAVVCMTVFEGKYAAKNLDEKGPSVPLFLFGGFDDFCLEHFNSKEPDFKDPVLMRKVSMALKSFKLAGERSSMNDICKYAKYYAEKIDKKFKFDWQTHEQNK